LLLSACSQKRLEFVQFILSKGVDVKKMNSRDILGKTIYHASLSHNHHQQLVRLIVERGARWVRHKPIPKNWKPLYDLETSRIIVGILTSTNVIKRLTTHSISTVPAFLMGMVFTFLTGEHPPKANHTVFAAFLNNNRGS
jgi:hypothetical protein